MHNTTTNIDIDYINKDYNSVVDALINYATVNYGSGTVANRLWTNFNSDSFSRTWLELVAYIADTFFFYFDIQSTESYLQTASLRSSVKDIAKQFGFEPASATSASGIVTFTVTVAGTIDRGFKVGASNGAEFYLTTAIVCSIAGDYSGTVIQGSIVEEQFTAEGLQNEEFLLRGPNIVIDLNNLNPLDKSPIVTVNGNSYILVSSLIRQNGTDSAVVLDSLGNVIGGGGRAFTIEEKPSGTPFIRFGDGIFGRKLMPGDSISIKYRTGGGSVGNIAKQTITTAISTSSIVSAVTNNADFSGGADEQTIEQLRELIPASLRTLDRAVAEQDYSDILVANFNEVFAASTEANTEDLGIDLNIYVVPQGSGITNISDNTILKNKLSAFLDRRKTVTTQFQILDAYGVAVLVTLEVFIADTASKSTIRTSIETALIDYFDLTNGGADEQGISFSEQILLKDIDNIIESIPGVERFEIKRLTYRPRIDSKVIGLITEYNTSSVQIYPTVTEAEWLIGAAGVRTETEDTVIFNNTDATPFTYNSSSGLIQYSLVIDLSEVSPGDKFRDGLGVLDFEILAVNTSNYSLYIPAGETVNTTSAIGAGGSIRNGNTAYESFKCFKKLSGKATNLSVDSITDTNMDLSVLSGVGSAVGSRLLLDNSNVFIPNQYSNNQYYLIDSYSNVWEILENDSNTIKTSISAVNDASIVNVSSGNYKIVQKMTGKQILFQGNIFTIQYNTNNTVYSISGQFNQIGTIGDIFYISTEQDRIGNLGVTTLPISYNDITGVLRVNSSVDLQGVNNNNVFIDSSGQIFNIVGIDNISKPTIYYEDINRNASFTLKGAGSGSNIGQGFKVLESDIYAIASFNLKRQGNIFGYLIAKVVDDDGTGKPDLSSIIMTSEPVSVLDIPETFSKVIFNFITPVVLATSTQYHLILIPDSNYSSSEITNVQVYTNTSAYTATVASVEEGTMTISFTDPGGVDLSTIVVGNYFQDGTGDLFKIAYIDDVLDTLLIYATSIDNSTNGHVFVYDNIELGINTPTPAFGDANYDYFSTFNGTNWTAVSTTDAIFSVEGTKSIILDSNLIPVLTGYATISSRYYDDNNEISLVIGISNGLITSALDVNALGKGTIDETISRVDNFVFRTSRYNDDIVNLRANEIPEIDLADANIQIYNGVD